MLSRFDLLFVIISIIAFIGVVFLIIYYKANDEDKQNGYLIAGWILVSPFLLTVAYIFISGIFF